MRSLLLALLLLAPSPLIAQTGDQGGEGAPRPPGVAEWFGIPRVAPESGSRTVAAGDTVRGDLAVRDGTLRVDGVVTGSAVAWNGDVVVGPDGAVLGDAVAVQGRVRTEAGGQVRGEVRAVRGDLNAVPVAAGTPEPPSVGDQVSLVLGWFVVVSLIGLGVLVFAGSHLQTTVETLQGAFGRSFLAGLAGQLAIGPVILLAIVALAITILGVLLIPFAIVALVLIAAGLMTLGFLAAAQVTGSSLTGARARRLSARGATLRALVVGVALYCALWLVWAVLAPWPTASLVVRGIAVAVTWAAVTAGFGAALLSRAGTRPLAAPEPAPSPRGLQPPAEEEVSWQTPTPIGGVAAARRPSHTATPSDR